MPKHSAKFQGHIILASGYTNVKVRWCDLGSNCGLLFNHVSLFNNAYSFSHAATKIAGNVTLNAPKHSTLASGYTNAEVRGCHLVMEFWCVAKYAMLIMRSLPALLPPKFQATLPLMRPCILPSFRAISSWLQATNV